MLGRFFFLLILQVRPLLPKERLGGEQACIRIGSTPNQVVVGTDKSFTFDHVLFNCSQQVTKAFELDSYFLFYILVLLSIIHVM